MKMLTKNIRALILIILSLSLFSSVSNAQNTVNNRKVILLDESHGQFINSSLLTGAIAMLKNNGYNVLTLTTGFTQEALNGVDMVIIPNPNKTSTFSDTETFALGQWITNQNNKGLFLLSNPLDLKNSSLNGASSVLDTILSSNTFLVSQKFVTGTDGNGELINKYGSTNDTTRLDLKVNSTIDLYLNSNLTIETKSTAISVGNNQSILDAGYDSFALTGLQTYTSQDVDIQLFGGFYFKLGKIILGGSTLMFSDLPNPYQTNKTWFNTANNKEFFSALVNWGLGITPDSNIKNVDQNFFVTLGLITGVVGIIFVVVGLVLFYTGKEMKIFEIDQNFLNAQASDSQEDKTGLTKSQKRLMQRKGK